MPITAAQVESNGWVLRLTLTGAMSTPGTNFSGYVFDPDGTPRLTLTSAHPGFVKSAGTALPGSLVRNTVGLRPLRKVVDYVAPLTKVIDETDLGGGSLQVRIALSETIYATETSLSLAVLAGWRTGEAAASGLAVTNASTIAAPVPHMRWVLPPYESTTGPFRISLLTASNHPVGFDPVAAVKFTITDGATTRTVWATTLSTDNSYGDNLRCHSVVFDPAANPATLQSANFTVAADTVITAYTGQVGGGFTLGGAISGTVLAATGTLRGNDPNGGVQALCATLPTKQRFVVYPTEPACALH